jgi:N-acetylglucosamine kinase-like BadF-type ATPase
MAFFLGLDAGGTKTTAVLGDETRILARAVGGSIKPLRVSIEQAQENLSALLAEISRISGVDLRQVSASCVGTAGLRLPQTDGWMRQIISHCAPATNIEVCGDEEIALDAAFPGGAGVLVIAGTGSNILGRTSSGRRLTVGGWGPMLGDQGSGYWIGHQALRAALRAKDFRRPTPLLDRIVAFWKVSEPAEVINIAHSGADFSLLAPIVVQCAEEGDPVALEVLVRGGRLLGEDAAEAFRQVRALEPDQPMPGIAFIGGILDKVAFVRDAMTETIRLAAPTVQILPEAVDAVSGALWRARHLI